MEELRISLEEQEESGESQDSGESQESKDSGESGESEESQESEDSGESEESEEAEESEDSGEAKETEESRGSPTVSRDKLNELGILPDIEQEGVAGEDEKDNPVLIVDRRNGKKVAEWYRRDIARELQGLQLTQKVKKYLLTLKAVGWNKGLATGRLDTNRLSRLYSTPLGNSPKIYKKREKPKVMTDIAITILIDDSGSMNSREKLEKANASAIGLSEVLQAVKIPHEILSFTTTGAKVVHAIIKDAAESFVSRDKLMDRMSQEDYRLSDNGDGQAVLWAAQRLSSAKERQKLLLVISDGAPAFSYSYRRDERRYLKDVVEYLENSKVMDIMGIGILDSSVKYFYSNYKVLKNMSDLEVLFMDLLKSRILEG
jgi:cobaltochelatase CobT